MDRWARFSSTRYDLAVWRQFTVSADEPPKIGQSLSFNDVARSNPDAIQEYNLWKADDGISVRINSFKINKEEEQYQLTVPSHILEEQIKRVFPIEPQESLSIMQEGHMNIVTFSATFMPYFSQYTKAPLEIGDVHIVPPIEEGIYLNTLSLYFATSFALGMLARYFPATWISLGHTERGDAVFPLTNRLMDLIQYSFPQVIMNFLEGPYAFEDQKDE